MYKMSSNENANAQLLEKSNFTRRCSLLSRYLKEKGSFGNINLGLVRKPDSDLGLPGNSHPQQGKQHKETKTLDISRRVSKGEPSSRSTAHEDTNLSKSSSEPGSSQLTIFFGGQVLVYNEFPADKAKEIMEVAKQAKTVAEVKIQTQINVENNNKDNKSNMVLPDLNEPTNSADINQQQQQQQQSQVVERIARRASLHRFFAKRKDRAVARAPYQVNQNAGHHHQYPPKPETAHGQPLESGQSSKRPETALAQTMSLLKPDGDKDTCMEIEEGGQCSKDLELRL